MVIEAIQQWGGGAAIHVYKAGMCCVVSVVLGKHILYNHIICFDMQIQL